MSIRARVVSLTLAAFLASVPAFADWQFECRALDLNVPEQLDELVLRINDDGEGQITYLQQGSGEVLLTENFKSRGLRGGEGRYRDYLNMEVIHPHFHKYPGSRIQGFFLEKSFLSGGGRLRLGMIGGTLVLPGKDWQAAQFICMRQ